MSDYTPTTGIVKGAYMIHKFQHEHVELEGSGAEFDRWLAEHDRQIAAAAWDESVYEMGRVWGDTRPERVDYLLSLNPYRRKDQP